MTKTRTNQEVDSIREILDILEATKYPEGTWVGKNYSKADLIRDLKKQLVVVLEQGYGKSKIAFDLW